MVVAIARGLAPPLVDTIHGAELWALACAMGSRVGGCQISTDHSALIAGAGAADAWSASPCKRWSSFWARVNHTLDGGTPRALCWKPSHTSEASIGAVLCGDGRWLTGRDRRGNALADHHAKECAKSASVDEAIRHRIDQQIATSTDGAKWMALITAEANAYRDSGGKVTRDSEGLTACQKRA